MILYRPVGVGELEKIAASGFRAFPPRLAWQPIFYPVLSKEYAEKIARDWNTADQASGHAGFVVRFEVEEAHAARYPVQNAGGRKHQELWVPAGELEEFNQHIVGKLTVEAVHYGEHFQGTIDSETGLPLSVVQASEEGKRI